MEPPAFVSFRPRWQAIAYTAGVFVLGAVIASSMIDSCPVRRDSSEAARRERDVQQFRRELGLNDAQCGRLRAVLAETQPALRDTESFLRSIRDEARSRVRAILTAEQRRRFDAMIETERRARRQGRAAATAGD